MTVQNDSIGFRGDSLPIFVDKSIDFKGTGSRICNIEQFYMLMNNSGIIILIVEVLTNSLVKNKFIEQVYVSYHLYINGLAI